MKNVGYRGPLSAVLLSWGLILLLSPGVRRVAAKDPAAPMLELASPSPKRSPELPPFALASDPPFAAAAEHELESYFDNTTSTNVTAQLGTTVYLHCVVRHLGERTVSWIRRHDFHILTVGLYTYSSDQRFQMIHVDKSDDWTLQIKYTQKRDEGLYECQVSSDPPISQFVTLNVVMAKAEIINAPELHAKSGSTLVLTCLISRSPEHPTYVFWYHNERMINFDKDRGIVVVTDKGETTVSKLTIRHALRADSGNYTCDPSNADATSITVHVLNGEKPAAMQHDGKASGAGGLSVVTLGLLGAYSTVYFGLR